MLQYIINENKPRDIIDIAINSLNNGCQWIRVDLSQLCTSEIESTIKTLQQKCNEHDAFLSIENDVETAVSFRALGVHLANNNGDAIVDARKRLGEETIIGITINDAAEAPFLPRTAIDYVAINSEDLKTCREVVEQMKASGLDEPVVAPYSNTTKLALLMQTGINGIAVHHSIIPTTKLPDLLDELNEIVEHRLKNL